MVENGFASGEKIIAFKPLIIAHRGASSLAPENTFAAFRRAIADGADGIELDVRLAKDGIPVVFHDDTLERIAGVQAPVADFTSAELQNFDVGSWFNRKFPHRANEKFAAEKVPTLEQLFEFLDGYDKLIYVELKGENAQSSAIAEAVCAVIRQTNLHEQIIVKSFDLESLKTVKRILPEIRTAALFEPKVLTVLRKRKHILKQAEACGAREISLHYSLATKKLVERARARNLSTVVWTVGNPFWVKRAIDLGIGALITNNPARLIKKRNKILQTNLN